MKPEFGGKIGDRTGPQHTGMARAPRTISSHIFELAAIGVINAAVQHEFARAPLDLRKRDFAEQRYGIVVQRAPTNRIEVAEKAGGIVFPRPPDVAGQAPEAFLGGRDEPVERARFA